MGGSSSADDGVEDLLLYYRDMELLLALLVYRYGEMTDFGCRLALPVDDRVRVPGSEDGTGPIIIQTFQADENRYVIEVV